MKEIIVDYQDDRRLRMNNLYNIVAKRHDTKPEAVQTCIRNAIKNAYNIGLNSKVEELLDIRMPHINYCMSPSEFLGFISVYLEFKACCDERFLNRREVCFDSQLLGHTEREKHTSL